MIQTIKSNQWPEMQVEITNMLTLSTAHLKPETLKDLDDTASKLHEELMICKKGQDSECYGYIIYCMDISVMNDYPDLKACAEFSLEIGCDIICFDSDAETVPVLPVYRF